MLFAIFRWRRRIYRDDAWRRHFSVRARDFAIYRPSGINYRHDDYLSIVRARAFAIARHFGGAYIAAVLIVLIYFAKMRSHDAFYFTLYARRACLLVAVYRHFGGDSTVALDGEAQRYGAPRRRQAADELMQLTSPSS